MATMENIRQILHTTKPTQEEMDTARKVLRWLSDHAHCWPHEWATVGDPDATATSFNLSWAADQCGDRAGLLTTAAEFAERDAWNQAAIEQENHEVQG